MSGVGFSGEATGESGVAGDIEGSLGRCLSCATSSASSYGQRSAGNISRAVNVRGVGFSRKATGESGVTGDIEGGLGRCLSRTTSSASSYGQRSRGDIACAQSGVREICAVVTQDLSACRRSGDGDVAQPVEIGGAAATSSGELCCWNLSVASKAGKSVRLSFALDSGLECIDGRTVLIDVNWLDDVASNDIVFKWSRHVSVLLSCFELGWGLLGRLVAGALARV